jgi:limonene 1,2-monooxygenase
MLCVAAAETTGFDALTTNWQTACEIAAEHGRRMDPRRLRLVAPFHIAETRDQARENVRFGMQAYVDYINNNMLRFNVPPGEDIVDYWMRVKIGVVGTPDDAIAQIHKLQAKQGEFGVMLHMANNIADWEATKRSYELYARYVMPAFDGSNVARDESYDWVTANRDTLSRQRQEAAQRMIDKHAAERAAKTGRKEVTDRRSGSLIS